MTPPPYASSLDLLQPSQIREIANIAFGMDGLLKLQFGESNRPTPQFIKDAAVQALADGYTFYSENQGIVPLRQALASKYQQLHGVDLDPAAQIMITASGTQAVNMGIRCTINPGDEALILTPNWPNGREVVKLYGAIPTEIPMVLEDGRYRIDFAALAAAVTPRTKMLLYTSPSNPLGWVASATEQQQLLDFARAHNLWLVADEVYERLYYSGEVAPSILRLITPDDAVLVVQSFSKTYNMTGWRLGWMVSRPDVIRKASQANEFVVSHAATFTQKAAVTALQDGDGFVTEMVADLQKQVALAYEALTAVRGITVPRPEGAFYLFPHIDGLTDSFAFAVRLLRESKVVVAPGVAFGAGGEGSIRICVAAERQILEPALERICRFIERGG